MLEPVDLREHEERTVALLPSEVEVLLRELPHVLALRPSIEPGHYLIRAGAQVGFVILPSGRTVTILPKAPVETVFALLAAVYDPNREVFRDEMQPYSTVTELFEFVVRMFVIHVEDLIARGILRGYQRFEEDIPVVRGRLLVAESIRRHPGLHHSHWCSYSRFIPDVPENRIVRWASYLLQYYLYREQSLERRLRRVGVALSPVTLDPEARRLFDKLAYNRLNDRYRPALRLANLLLDQLTFSGSAGDSPFLAYLIDMNWLFERYVSCVLGQRRQDEGIEIREQDSHPLDAEGHVTIRPDMIILQHGKPALVVDAKYKLDPSGSDIYQALAYCYALNLSRAVLIHPAHEHAPQGHVSILGPGNIQIHYASLDLRGNPSDLEKQANALREYVSAYLVTTLRPLPHPLLSTCLS